MAEVGSDGGLLLVHAHPDDEAFATGGVIARAVAEGRRVDLVTCTGGEEGEIHDPTLDEAEARPRLREIREAELRCALAALAADGPGSLDLHLLGYRDSGMIGTEPNERPDAFWQADLDQATARLLEIVRSVRPAAMVTYDANGNYGHPDHINAHRIAAAAWEASAGEPWAPERFYEIAFNRDRWFTLMGRMRERGLKLPWDLDQAADAAHAPDAPDAPDAAEGKEPESFGVPEADITTVVDVAAHTARKRACMACHRTQWQDMGWVLDMPEDLADLALAPEHFILTHARTAAADDHWFW